MFLKSKRENEQRERVIAYKRAFGGAEGKTVLFHLMNTYHVLNTHDGNPYSEGQRSVILEILRNVNINLVEFDKLLRSENEPTE